jgi:hypothetical protein
MPWCDDCAKFWNPNSMPPDGACPTCDRIIAEPPDVSVPWHFWLLLVAAGLYLAWRAIEGVRWLADRGHTEAAIALGSAGVALVVGGGLWWFRSRRPSGD